jgi:hypothetical protein
LTHARWLPALPLLLISEASKQPLELVEVELLSVKETAVELLKL